MYCIRMTTIMTEEEYNRAVEADTAQSFILLKNEMLKNYCEENYIFEITHEVGGNAPLNPRLQAELLEADFENYYGDELQEQYEEVRHDIEYSNKFKGYYKNYVRVLNGDWDERYCRKCEELNDMNGGDCCYMCDIVGDTPNSMSSW